MKSELYPLVFEPDIHPTRWGVERWLVSAHEFAPSVIANGPLRGNSLREVMPDLKVLVKVLDVKHRLSLQVHPNESNAAATGGEPKTELWHVLQSEKGASIIAGFRARVNESKLLRALATETVEKIVRSHRVAAGETCFIPGGLVHALGGGLKVFEVQQSSNSTYRLYDWGLVGADGRPRPLHVAESLKTLDYSLELGRVENGAFECPAFAFREFPHSESGAFEPIARHRIYFVKGGTFVIESPRLDRSFVLVHDSAFLLPAGIGATYSSIRGAGELIEVTAP